MAASVVSSARAPWQAPERPRKVLVAMPNWLGDLAMSLPALRALRRGLPRARLSVLVRDSLAGFFDGARWVDQVIAYPRGPRSPRWRGVGPMLRTLRSQAFDLAVLFPNSFESALWPALAGVPTRVGYSRDGRRPLLTHPCVPTPAVLRAHQSRYYLYLIESILGISGDPRESRVEPAGEHVARMRLWLAQRRRRSGKLLALAPGAAYGPAKQWPAEHYTALVGLLASRGAETVLVGSREDVAVSARIAAASQGSVLVAAGETTVGEALALLSLCDGFVGNDSGSMHLAVAVGLPTVGLFGSTDPARTGAGGSRTRVIHHAIPCSPCLSRKCRYGHYRCLAEISPVEVARQLEDLGVLNGSSS